MGRRCTAYPVELFVSLVHTGTTVGYIPTKAAKAGIDVVADHTVANGCDKGEGIQSQFVADGEVNVARHNGHRGLHPPSLCHTGHILFKTHTSGTAPQQVSGIRR